MKRGFIICFSSSSVFMMIISRRMGQAEHITHLTDKRNAYKILLGKPKAEYLFKTRKICINWAYTKVGF
jgi:hypothetical protein